MNICFLIVDMQKAFLNQKVGQAKIDAACEYINYISEMLRAKNQLIVHIKDVESLTSQNAAQYDFIGGIHQDTSDLTIEKVASNAFWDTDLEDIARKANTDLIIVSGFAAENCVLFTHNGARERGFRSVILQHGILSGNADMIAATYRDRDLISYPVIEALLA